VIGEVPLLDEVKVRRRGPLDINAPAVRLRGIVQMSVGRHRALKEWELVAGGSHKVEDSENQV
jgi:hypothetical protein